MGGIHDKVLCPVCSYLSNNVTFFSLAQQPKSGLDGLLVEVSGLPTLPVGLLWTSDKLVAEAATYTTHNKQNLSGIRTRDPNNRPAAGLHLRPHGHRDRPNCVNIDHDCSCCNLYELLFILCIYS